MATVEQKYALVHRREDQVLDAPILASAPFPKIESILRRTHLLRGATDVRSV